MNAIPPKFKVIFTNSDKDRLALQYELADTPAAWIWFECMKKARNSGGIKETRFYDFPNRGENYLNELLQKFDIVVKNLSGQFPELLEQKLDTTSIATLQLSLNQLHRNFAHNHLVEVRVSTSNLENWHQFNSLIHSIENEVNSSRHPVAPEKINRSRVEFNWVIPYETDIPDNCYSEFTLQREFGDLQIIYCDVGRHLIELFHADDRDVPIEHIRPHRHFSANTGLHFGYAVDAAKEQKNLAKIHTWFKQHEEKFNKAGVFWDQPNRSLGFVKAASLMDAPKDIKAQREFQMMLSKYTKVIEVDLL